MIPSQVNKTYFIRAALFTAGYTFFLVASYTGAFDDVRAGAGWGIALAASAPVAGHLWAFLAWMVLALVSAAGFLEIHAHTPRFPGALIVPLFWLAWGAVSPVIQTSR